MPTAVVTTRGREASLSILTDGYTPAGPVHMILMAEGHVFQQDVDTVADISGDEITATGYSRQAVSFDALATQPDGTVTQQSEELSFGVVGGALDATISGCYLYYRGIDDANSIVIACVEFVSPATTDGTELIVKPISLNWGPTPF